MATSSPPRSARAAIRYKIHWHALLIHFPVSGFLGSSLFMAIHLVSGEGKGCFEQAAYIALLSGAAILIPATLTGWFTWKQRYKGALTRIFQYKIITSLTMIAICLVLIVWRAFFAAYPYPVWHPLYATGIFLLLIGTMIEGYYGSRLSHG